MTNSQKFAVGIGVTGIALVALLFAIWPFGKDDEKELTLAVDGNNNCIIRATAKGKDFRVDKGHKVSYKITNTCAPQVVLVGNFRRDVADGDVKDCNVGKVETVWPFRAADQSVRQVYIPDSRPVSLTLKDAKNDVKKTESFYFDICVGRTKVDPRLDIDP